MKNVPLLLGLIFLLIAPSVAYPGLYFRGDLNYQTSVTTSAGARTDDSTSFQQGYTLGFTKDLTSTLALGGDIRLIINETDGVATDDVYPLFYLNFNPPPIFNFSFSSNRTETAPSGGERVTTGYTNATLGLPFENYPSFLLSYNRQTAQDYLAPHELDTLSSGYAFTTNYSKTLLGFENTFAYSFGFTSSEDKVSGLTTTSPSHSATGTISRSFWDDKIRAEADFGYSFSDTTNESLVGPTRFEQEETFVEGLYAENSAPSTGTLTSNAALVDNNTGSSAGLDLNGTYRNIGVRLPLDTTLHKLHLYITTTDTNIANYTINWELYTSADGITWSLAAPPTVTYESVYSRYVFSFTDTTAEYFKVVNTTFPVGAQTINITEIDAISYLLSTPSESVTTSVQRDYGSFKVSIQPVERLTIGHNLNYDHYTQNLNNSDSLNLSNSTNLNLVIFPKYLSMFTSYTLTGITTSEDDASTGITETVESGSSTYSLSFTSSPLKTLSGSLSFSSGDGSTDGETTSTSNSVSGDVYMRLYTGVDVKFGVSISQSESMESDTTTDSTYYYSNVNLIPWEPVTAFVTIGSTASTTESQGTTTEGTSSNLQSSLTYSPTRKLYFTASINIEPTMSQSLSVTLLPTRNSQAWFSYGISEDMTNLALSLNFNPVSAVSVQFGVNSTTTETTDETVDSAYMKLSFSL